MSDVPNVFSYKLVRDYGFAPNPFHGICTLGTCKPQIRRSAKVGDIIVGCGSTALKLEGRIIFAMRVSHKLSFQEYWEHEAFQIKRPNLHSSKSMAYGDNIYHRDGEAWIQEDSHHSFVGGEVNHENLLRDTSSDNVLIGEEFVYWGSSAVKLPDHLRHFAGEDLYPPSRNYRSTFTEDFRAEVDTWFKALADRGCRGRPASWR
ncbi:hypothetical protein FHJ31_03930 [Pseudomonas sp. Fig-3]|uniref:Nmad2 family putative nucleotide modification protein n=1 Tax=unclassified Pseudomonas TaxID=196821 RepID=UPI0010D3F970|nr:MULTISPECIES: hypothetical protein [unclassified Pseudomonas]TNB88511.1 hypothetical protein FHJ31_03930 [Pseudomonas sp. Fig-3]VII94164.1 hypothetical protein [Pseudomonas sp. FG-3G]